MFYCLFCLLSGGCLGFAGGCHVKIILSDASLETLLSQSFSVATFGLPDCTKKKVKVCALCQ